MPAPILPAAAGNGMRSGVTFQKFDRDDGVALAFESREGAKPTFVWLGGFLSDMTGTKAEELSRWAQERGQAFLRLDYSGHGQSGGTFEEGGVARWCDDALAVIRAKTNGPLVLVGSSMGAWIALLAVAPPAPDFTEDLLWPRLPEAARRTISAFGRWQAPAGEGYPGAVYTRALFEDGRRHRVLQAPIAFNGPVRILQGREDLDVPWHRSLGLVDKFTSADVAFTLLKDGDHRLSRPQDLKRLRAEASALAEALTSA